MKATTNVIKNLKSKKISHQIIEYTYDADNLSVEKIAADNNLNVRQVFKTLVAKGDKTGIQVAVIPGDKSLNLKALAKASGNKKIALIPVKEIQKWTGYVRGGCSPMGMKKDYPVWFDEAILEWEMVFVNAGKRGVLVGLAPEDVLELTSGEVVRLK